MLTVISILAILATHYPEANSINRQEIYCIAHAVYHEARGESILGQGAVAAVVLNRTDSKRHPNEACSVVYEPHQFTDIKKTKPKRGKAWETAVSVAALVYMGHHEDPTGGSLHYYAHGKVSPVWARYAESSYVIGNHTFLVGVK